MDKVKIIVGGLLGGLANFFIGWLLWSLFLWRFAEENIANKSAIRTEDQLVLWALLAGNIAYGCLLAFVLHQSRVTSALSGFKVAAITGLLTHAAFDLTGHAQYNLFNPVVILPDVILAILVSGAVGSIIGWYYGKGPLNKII